MWVHPDSTEVFCAKKEVKRICIAFTITKSCQLVQYPVALAEQTRGAIGLSFVVHPAQREFFVPTSRFIGNSFASRQKKRQNKNFH